MSSVSTSVLVVKKKNKCSDHMEFLDDKIGKDCLSIVQDYLAPSATQVRQYYRREVMNELECLIYLARRTWRVWGALSSPMVFTPARVVLPTCPSVSFFVPFLETYDIRKRNGIVHVSKPLF
jgi:hypothetical protein